MKVLIKQPAGLGDVFFCQKIAAHFAKKHCCPVIWPVLPHFTFVRDYLRPTVETEFVSLYDTFEFRRHYAAFETMSRGTIEWKAEDCHLINTDGHSNEDGVMKVKYRIFDLDWRDWLDYFHFERKLDKEAALLKHLNIGENEEFVFVNKKFASLPDIQEVSTIRVPEGIRIVELQVVLGFNIFDWCGVLERAKQIHTVETSFCYLLERLNCTQSLFMYARNKNPDFRYIDGIYSKPWVYEKAAT